MEGFVAYQGALGKTKYFQLLTSDANHLSPDIQKLGFFESWICRSYISFFQFQFIQKWSSQSPNAKGFLHISSDSFRVPTQIIRMAAAISGVRTLQVATKKGIWGKGRTLISKMPHAATTVTAYRIPQKCCEICLEIQAQFFFCKKM